MFSNTEIENAGIDLLNRDQLLARMIESMSDACQVSATRSGIHDFFSLVQFYLTISVKNAHFREVRGGEPYPASEFAT